jgi:hypothetical protein
LPTIGPTPHSTGSSTSYTDHQRFDKADRRQKFPHACAPTRDLDTGLPAFTTR